MVIITFIFNKLCIKITVINQKKALLCSAFFS